MLKAGWKIFQLFGGNWVERTLEKSLGSDHVIGVPWALQSENTEEEPMAEIFRADKKR